MSATTDTDYIDWLTRQEFIWYGDTIIGEPPPFAVGGPETLVVLYTQGWDVFPAQPVPDFWQSIWDVNCSTQFSITRWYKEMSFGEQIIYAFPQAHWDGNWYYCFQVDTITPPHTQRWVWYRYCPKALAAADPEINFANYTVPGQPARVVVLALSPGGGSGLCWPGGWGLFSTNDVFPNGEPVYVTFLWGLRGDAWANTSHIAMNVHEYGHCCGWPDTYGNVYNVTNYNMGSFCGHWGAGFCRFHAWVDAMPSPLNPQWRYETKDRYTNQPWLTPTEITQTQLNYPIMPLRETYNGEVLRIRPTQMPGISPSDTQTFLITNHQCLTPYEYNFPDSGLLIWHVTQTKTAVGWDWPDTRRRRPVRVEYATGLWQWDSIQIDGKWHWWPTTPDPISGFDSLDMGRHLYTAHPEGVWPPIGDPLWRGFGSAGGFWDPPEYTRFDAFTNPSTNFYDIWHPPICPEWIHSHFALRNLHPDPNDNTILRADILLNYVQSDVATATSYNNSRHIVSDAAGNVYIVYEAGGYVYFTKTKIGTMVWEPAYPVGKGNSPSIALDNNNVPNIVWVHKDTLFWAKRQNYYTWPKYALYKPVQPGWEAYFCETPSFVWDHTGYGHIAFEKYIYANGVFSLLLYGKLDPAHPEQITWEMVDSDYGLIRCRYPSIAVDGLNNPHIAWQKAGEIYYRQKDANWSEIRNISNSTDDSYTPFIEISSNWLHIVWVEEPTIPPDQFSNIRHIRRDLGTGLWYPPQWVETSPVYSKLPQTIKGEHIVWTEYEIPDGNIEIYHSVWNYETGAWGPPENISNTLNTSNAPQVTIASGPPLPNRYLATIWCEDDGVLYEVRKDKKLLPEPWLFTYIELGGEISSPYTVERDGYIVYGAEDYKTVDYDSTKLIYRITGFEDNYKYRIKFILYHEFNNKQKLKIRIDNSWTRNVWVNPDELTVVEGIIPEALIKDGEILITDEIIQGDLAVLSSIIIYQEPKGQGGPQVQEVVNIGNKAEPLVIKPNPVKDKAEIYYQVNSPGIASLALYDITGRKVKSFINSNLELGYYKLNWNGTDDTGRRLSEGVYFIRLENQAGSLTQKVIIMR
ncbi:MAG: T9SS type A sorting domain-containing protein [candidate division WOR-3 bacterium]